MIHVDELLNGLSLVSQTHSFHKAHWEGKCDLPLDVQHALMVATETEHTERSISDSLQCLSTT